jgi:hypothetical protein
MLSATLQPPLRLVPLHEIALFRSGHHPRAHLTPAGVLDELHRRHAYAMLVRAGDKPKTSRAPGALVCRVQVDALPSSVPAGGRLVAQARAVNLGDTLWLARPSRFGGYVTFGVKWTQEASGRVVADAPGRTLLPADVPPGGETAATLVLDLPASVVPGEYVLKVDLVDEFVCWFSDIPPNRPSEHRIRVSS